MTEMLNLEPIALIPLTHNELDAIVKEFYGGTYSTLRSDEDMKNYTYLKYSIEDDYDERSPETFNYEEELQKWRDSDSEPLTGAAEFMRIRDDVYLPHWTFMLTLLIDAGRIPKSDYLLEVSW